QNEVPQAAVSSGSIEEGPSMPMGFAPTMATMGSTASGDQPAAPSASARLVMEVSEGAPGGMSIGLHLQNAQAQGEAMTLAMAVTVIFVVDNDAHDFVPAALNTTILDEFGNSITWTHDAQSGYILTVTLAAGQSELHIPPEAFLAQDGTGLGDHLHLILQSVGDAQGNPLDGLDVNIHTGDDNPPLHPGDQVDFAVVDADYGAAHHSPHHDGADAADGYAQGSDVLIGNSNGSDTTYIWNNHNMGGEQETIKDFRYDAEIKDSLRFDDLFAGQNHEEAAISLDNLLLGGSATWDGKNFFATDGSSTIAVNLVDSVASLTVSYHDPGSNQQYSQTINLEGFANHFDGIQDAAEVAHMLCEIIKVGGIA
ncbi:MAG: hypothetical protein LBI88_00440, partial [Deltaproteobacteria bacterium]|nr:hypothetical protein [Deltaproteobacteria bacterium]